MQDVFCLYEVFVRLHAVVDRIIIVKDVVRVDRDIDRCKDRGQDHGKERAFEQKFFHHLRLYVSAVIFATLCVAHHALSGYAFSR